MIARRRTVSALPLIDYPGASATALVPHPIFDCTCADEPLTMSGKVADSWINGRTSRIFDNQGKRARALRYGLN